MLGKGTLTTLGKSSSRVRTATLLASLRRVPLGHATLGLHGPGENNGLPDGNVP